MREKVREKREKNEEKDREREDKGRERKKTEIEFSSINKSKLPPFGKWISKLVLELGRKYKNSTEVQELQQKERGKEREIKKGWNQIKL